MGFSAIRWPGENPEAAPTSHVPSWLIRAVSGLGLLLAASPAGAAGRKSVSPHHSARPSPDMPWTETGGSLPPLPPVRSGGSQAPWSPAGNSSTAHPAVHPDLHEIGAGKAHQPLFPKARPQRSREERTAEEPAQRAACMRRHPAGRALRENAGPEIKRHTVEEGDTLWDIAGAVLGTDDPAAIARYWPRIHRANRDVIGRDPSVLAVGQVLVLPTVVTERA